MTKNQKIIYLVLLSILFSCSKENENTSGKNSVSEREVNFIKNEDDSGSRTLITLKVKIYLENGTPVMKNDDIREFTIYYKGEKRIMYSYFDRESLENREVVRKRGYLFDGDKCFVHCTYLEDTVSGTILPERCCEDTAGNCVGLDPVCAGSDEGWA